MSGNLWVIPGDVKDVEAALRAALGLGRHEPLVKYHGVKRIPVKFSVSATDVRLPEVEGLSVSTRKVEVSINFSLSAGFLKSHSDQTKERVVADAQGVVKTVRERIVDRPAQLVYELRQRGADLGYKAAMTDDVVAGLLPFALEEGVLARRGNGKKVGTLKVGATSSTTYERSSHGSTLFVVTAKLELTGASEVEAKQMATAMRSWIRGRALVDRIPLQLREAEL